MRWTGRTVRNIRRSDDDIGVIVIAPVVPGIGETGTGAIIVSAIDGSGAELIGLAGGKGEKEKGSLYEEES